MTRLFFACLIFFISSANAQGLRFAPVAKNQSSKDLPAKISFQQFNFYKVSSLPFFCRQEIKMEKSLQIPLRFRLGNMEYNNWLEQKTKLMPQH